MKVILVQSLDTGHRELMTRAQFNKKFGKAEGKEILAGYLPNLLAIVTDGCNCGEGNDLDLGHCNGCPVRKLQDADTGRWPRQPIVEGEPLHVACLHVGHNAVNCLHSDLPIAKWCAPCRKAWVPDPNDGNARATIKAAIALFPKEFGLKAYAGTFSISEAASYVTSYGDDGKVMLYTVIKNSDGTWETFCKGTVPELKAAYVPLCGYCNEKLEGGPRCSHCGGL